MAEDKDVVYELFYYDSRGLVEPIRYILSRSGVKWNDNRTPIPGFPTQLPPELKQRCPFGQVPLLEWDGHQLSQSAAIARFLARKFNFVGANDLESAKCDELVDAARDFYTPWSPLYMEQDEAKKKQLKESAVALNRERFLSAFDSILDKRAASGDTTGYFVGNGLTWADIVVAHFIDQAQRIFGADFNLAQDFPRVNKLVEQVFNEPGIKDWIEKRPKTIY